MSADPTVEATANLAREYASACADVVRSINAVVEIANRADGARTLSQQGHEISRQHFRRMLEEQEAEFVPAYKSFIATCNRARSAAANLRNAPSSTDPELVLLVAVDDHLYSQTGVAVHLLRTTFGTTTTTFLATLESANEAIKGDIFHYGEDGFLGHIYSPPNVRESAPIPVPTPASEPATNARGQTWPELRSHLARRLPVANVDDSVVRVELAARGRRQAISVRWQPDAETAGWVIVESPFAPVADAAMAAVIHLLGSPKLLVGVARVDDALVVRWTGFVSELSGETLVNIIGHVAGVADRLEDRLSDGGDSF